MKILYALVWSIVSCTAFAQTSTTMNKDQSYSTEIIRYKISAAQQADFEAAYTKAGEFLKASPYCLSYDIVHGVEEPEHYIIRIHWTSVDDHLQKFRNSAEFKSFFALVRPFYTSILEMKHYTNTGIAWEKN
jgi:quinol monooxygenase YgiN